MDIFQKHEIFEIELLERLKNNKFLEPLVFGGGTMLRLCHELPRYSADLDFWFVKKIRLESYFSQLKQNLAEVYEITDAQSKYFTLLTEIRSKNYPRRLKIEIRKEKKECDYQDRIAFSKFNNRQVILRTHTLEQTMFNKIQALLDRKDIRDAYDMEFLLRKGISLPDLAAEETARIKKIIVGFSTKDFKVTLGSVLEKEKRNYYVQNGFNYLREKLRL
jgi:predicted nucleotidyltransferase component of viral defense system